MSYTTHLVFYQLSNAPCLIHLFMVTVSEGIYLW